jgi:hypothetical protein
MTKGFSANHCIMSQIAIVCQTLNVPRLSCPRNSGTLTVSREDKKCLLARRQPRGTRPSTRRHPKRRNQSYPIRCASRRGGQSMARGIVSPMLGSLKKWSSGRPVHGNTPMTRGKCRRKCHRSGAVRAANIWQCRYLCCWINGRPMGTSP